MTDHPLTAHASRWLGATMQAGHLGSTEVTGLRIVGDCACELQVSGRLFGVVMGQPWLVHGDPASDDEIVLEDIGRRVTLRRGGIFDGP